MKITQSQLRQIIKEELEEVSLMDKSEEFGKQEANKEVTVSDVKKIINQKSGMTRELIDDGPRNLRVLYSHAEFIENIVKIMNELQSPGVSLKFLEAGVDSLYEDPNWRKYHPFQWLQGLFSVFKMAKPDQFANKSPTFKKYLEDFIKFQKDPKRHSYNWYQAKQAQNKQRGDERAAAAAAAKEKQEREESDAALMRMYAASQMKEGARVRITQSQLRQIIEEELEAALDEKIEKVDGGYYVTSKSGRRLSKKPHKTRKAALAQLGAVEASKAEAMNEEELDERCQKGYKTHEKRKTKTMYGKTYRNCVKAEQLELDEKKRKKKKKKKKKGKDDRCTRIAKRKYDVWPSAYASGAVVQCRRGKIWKGVKEAAGDEEDLERKIRRALRDEGGAAGMDALVKHTDASKADIKAAIREMDDVGRHEDGDYILDDGDTVNIVDEKKNVGVNLKEVRDRRIAQILKALL